MTVLLEKLRASLGTEFGRMLGGSAFFFGGRVGGAAATYLTQLVLARWLGGSELGSYVRAFSWCVLLTNLALLGLGNAAMRFVGEGIARQEDGHIRGFLRRAWQISAGVSTVVALLAIVGLVLFGGDLPSGDRWTLLMAFLAIPVFSGIRLGVGIAHAFSWFRLTVLSNAVLRPVILLLLVTLGWRLGISASSAGVMALHLTIMAVILAGLAWVLLRGVGRTLHPSPPVYETRLWVRTATPLLLISMFTLFYPELNVVLAGTLLTNTELAVFNAGYRTALIIAFGLTAVDNVNIPAIAQLHAAGDQAGFQRVLARGAQLKFWGGLSALAVLGLWGEGVLALFGPEFVVGHGTLLVLAVVQVIRAAIGPTGEILSVTGYQDACLLVYAVSLVATVLLNLAIIPWLGMLGCAYVVLVVTVASNLWLRAIVTQRLGVDPSILGARLAPS